MFKKNKILVGCLALLLVLSVGYALFSETIEINGTATAKGNFEITASCVNGYSNELVTGGVYGSKDEGQTGYTNDTCSITSGNKVSFSTGLDAPGSGRMFTIKVTNTGTIDAMVYKSQAAEDYRVANVVTKVCPLLENGEASTSCTKYMEYNNANGKTSDNIYGYKIAALETNGVICLATDSTCATEYMNSNEDLILKVGSSVYYVAGFFWPSDYVSGYDNGFKATASMDIPFVQVTAQ